MIADPEMEQTNTDSPSGSGGSKSPDSIEDLPMEALIGTDISCEINFNLILILSHSFNS